MARSGARARIGTAVTCALTVAISLMPSTASAQCGAVADATYVTANAQNAAVTIYWSSASSVVILEKTSAFSTEALTNGTTYTVGNTVGSSAKVQYASSGSSFARSGALNGITITNGTTAYYKLFVNSSNCYSSGVTVSATPSTTVLWSYDTIATTLAAPGIDPNNVVVWGGNDNDIHGVSASNGTLAFPPSTQPTGAIQARPTIIPSSYSITGANVAYVSSQDGFVYALNTTTGAQLWKSTVPGSSLLQGGSAVWLQSVVALAICGASTDVVFIGTRDTVNRTTNAVYALNGGTTNVTSTGGGNCRANGTNVVPGDYLWKFSGATGGNPSMDYISSSPYIDYTTNALWVASRAQAGTAQPSLWKFNVQTGNLFNDTTSCGSGATTSCWNLNDIDYSPAQSYDGTWIYVGNVSGGTVKAVQGATVYSYTDISGSGAVKGVYPMGTTTIGTTSTIAYVSSTSTANSSASTTCVLGAGNTYAMTAGNTNVVMIVVANSSQTVTGVTDSLGSVYGYRSFANATGLRVEIWAAPTIAGTGTTSGTITVSMSSSYASVCAVSQYSGVGGLGASGSLGSQSSKNPSFTSTASTLDANNLSVAAFGIVNATAPTQKGGTTLREAPTASPTALTGALTEEAAITAGTAVVSDLNHATATWAATGVELRSVSVDTLVFSRGNLIKAISFNGSSNPTLNWFSITTTYSTPVDDGAGHIYVGGTDGKVHQLNAVGGTTEKQVTIPGTPTVGDPAFDGVLNRVYVGTSDGHVYAITTPF